MSLELVKQQLEDYYRDAFPHYPDASVSDLVSINEGWESVIYTYKLSIGSGVEKQHQNLVLRIYPGSDAVFKSRREYQGMQALLGLGYLVPRVIHLEQDHSPFEGRPFVLMEYIEGQMMWPVLDQAQPDRAVELITQFCELFVQLHKLDWRAFVSKEQLNSHQELFFCVDRFLQMISRETENSPDLKAFSPVLDWLEERRNLVPCTGPAPVHWDFHPGNVILKPDGTAVVIDWTQIQVSDPRFDLAWTLLLAGAYAGENVREMILDEYQRMIGVPVEQLAFFDVASCLKRLGTVMISLSAGADSMGMRPDAVAMMRRDFPALRWVYDFMVDRTGIQVLEIEKLLDS